MPAPRTVAQCSASSSAAAPRTPWWTCTAETSYPSAVERVPEAGRVGATRDEARDPATRRDEVVGADERLDARCQRLSHTPSVTDPPVGPTASSSASPRRRPGRPAAARRRAGCRSRTARRTSDAFTDASVPGCFASRSIESFRTRCSASIQTSSGSSRQPCLLGRLVDATEALSLRLGDELLELRHVDRRPVVARLDAADLLAPDGLDRARDGLQEPEDVARVGAGERAELAHLARVGTGEILGVALDPGLAVGQVLRRAAGSGCRRCRRPGSPRASSPPGSRDRPSPCHRSSSRGS